MDHDQDQDLSIKDHDKDKDLSSKDQDFKFVLKDKDNNSGPVPLLRWQFNE